MTKSGMTHALYAEGRKAFMKKIFARLCMVLCCLLPFSACSSPDKAVEEHVELALAQLGAPMGEAYEALGLPGDPEDAVDMICLIARDGAELLGKQMTVVLMPYEGGGKEMTERPTSIVEYSVLLDGDYAYGLRLYKALQKIYGEPEPADGVLPFREATEDSLKSLGRDEKYGAHWEKDGSQIELFVYGGEESRVSVQIAVPPIRPVFMPDGTRIR